MLLLGKRQGRSTRTWLTSKSNVSGTGFRSPSASATPVYATSDVAVKVLKDRGYHFARAGGARAFDPAKDNALLMPQAFDGKPGSTFEQFVEATALARDGRIAVMTFHGIPDSPHPWVSTTPENLNDTCSTLLTKNAQSSLCATSPGTSLTQRLRKKTHQSGLGRKPRIPSRICVLPTFSQTRRFSAGREVASVGKGVGRRKSDCPFCRTNKKGHSFERWFVAN